jgi:hypothetical protein
MHMPQMEFDPVPGSLMTAVTVHVAFATLSVRLALGQSEPYNRLS